MVNYSLIFIS